MNPNLYKHGLPFSEKIAENVTDIYNRVKKTNKAGCIIIDGGVGEGKTTLATEIADYCNFLDGKEELNLKQKEVFQLGLGGLNFIKNLRIVFGNGFPVVIYDEGGDFNRRGALTQFNQMINRIFETYRAFKVIVIICLPSFKVVDQDLLLKGIPRLLIHCEDRTLEYGNIKGYSLQRMYYILYHMKKLVVPNYAYEIVEPNFRGHFLDLSPERSKMLDKLSTDSKLLETEKAEIKMEGLVSAKDISRKVGKTLAWVCYALKELNLKPERKISRTQYYKEENVIDVLWNYNVKGKEKVKAE